MNRKTFLISVISVLLSVNVFAQNAHQPEPVSAAIPEGKAGTAITQIILNNEFYLESVRLNKLASEAYEYGDYDASAKYAEEALRYAKLSDEYAANKLIEEAKRLLAWADENNAASRYPGEYHNGKAFYGTAVAENSIDERERAIIAAAKSIEILSFLQDQWGKIAVLPGQYTVRTWAGEKDCLWNIAGYPWVYGDPRKWKELYKANKDKLADPNNPNLIEPGMILDIPSVKGEVRQGMWDIHANYDL